MSNFGAKLAELLERNKMRAADLARVATISEALISKWINGQQTFVSADDLAKICGFISAMPKEQAELLKSHLLDELGAPGSELISINIKGQVNYTSDAPRYRVALPLKIQRALDIVGQNAITDADVRAVLLGLAGIVAPDAENELACVELNEPLNSTPAQQAAEAQIVAAVAQEVSYRKSKRKKSSK